MAIEANASLPPTLGALLTRASAAVTNSGASRDRECPSPRSLLSRILHRRRGGGGFGCRLRLLRYCSSGAAKEDATIANDVGSLAEADPPRESPRGSLGGKKAPSMADDALPASLGLGASLVLLLSKSAAELSRMAELRAQMERLMMDVKADVRSCNGRPSASDGHTDSDSVVKEPIVCAGGDEEGALSQSYCSRMGASASRGGGSENTWHSETMVQMEAELEAELARSQLASNDEENGTPRRDHQVEEEVKSGATSGSKSAICSHSDINDAATDHDGVEDQDGDEEEDECDTEGNAKSPPLGGVSARELERRLHELLQSRHEARIAELESELEHARKKLKEKEREACRWRDTAKLAAHFTDESRLR